MYFFFNDTATTEIYTLSLHDALPISRTSGACYAPPGRFCRTTAKPSSCWCSTSSKRSGRFWTTRRSEEHTSELQSRQYLVCRLLLEKKKKKETEGLPM